MAARIFVVSGDDSHRSRLIDVLSGAGYRTSGAATFAEAKQVLGSSSADLVIAEERLGAFNGLHVIVLGRAVHPDMKAIVMTAQRDPALETDARRLNVDCVVESADPEEWLESVSRTLDAATPCAGPTIHRRAAQLRVGYPVITCDHLVTTGWLESNHLLCGVSQRRFADVR